MLRRETRVPRHFWPKTSRLYRGENRGGIELFSRWGKRRFSSLRARGFSAAAQASASTPRGRASPAGPWMPWSMEAWKHELDFVPREPRHGSPSGVGMILRGAADKLLRRSRWRVLGLLIALALWLGGVYWALNVALSATRQPLQPVHKTTLRRASHKKSPPVTLFPGGDKQLLCGFAHRQQN
jgi:hypothetical protein